MSPPGKSRAIRLLNGSSSLLGICVSPDGRYAYVTHISPATTADHPARTRLGQHQRGDYYRHRPYGVSTRFSSTMLILAANPWGIACTPDGQWSRGHLGTHELSILTASACMKLAAAEGGWRAGQRAERPVLHRGTAASRETPRQRTPGVAALDSRVFAAEYFSGARFGRPHRRSHPARRILRAWPRTTLDPERAGDLFS